MPVSFGPSLPNGPFGPGSGLFVSTSFVGPFAGPTNWHVLTSVDDSVTQPILEQVKPLTTRSSEFIDFGADRANPVIRRGFTQVEGSPIFLVGQVRDGPSQTIVDEGQEPRVWAPSSNLAYLLQQVTGQGQGLTEEQAEQLADLHAATFPVTTVAELGQVLLNSVPSNGPINANLITPGFGVIVRLTFIPEELQPQTPDDLYWVPTLAVVRLFRGTDVWLRVPIHTESKIIGFQNELVVTAVDALTTLGWPPTLTLQVTFRQGVLGQVILLNFP